MKRILLSLVVIVPLAVFAQNRAADGPEHAPGAVAEKGAGQADDAATAVVKTDAAVAGDDAAGTPQQPQPPRQSKSATTSRPKTEGSMVGYVENAIVGSQIRIRFDAAWGDSNPDLAEFFYAKCGCYRGLATAIPAAYDPKAAGPGLGVPNKVNFQQLYINGEYAPNSRVSFFMEVPFRWLQPQGFQAIPPFPGFSSQAGISDIRFGGKFGVVASDNTALTFQFKAYAPSGDPAKGMGTNHASIEPALLFNHRLNSRSTFEAQLGDWHPIGGDKGVPTATSSGGFAGDVFFWGFGPSYNIYNKNNVSVTPVLEMVGWHILGGFVTAPGGPILGAAKDASGINIVNIKFGARFGFGGHNSIYTGFGHALTSTDWYDNLFRMEYRYSF